MKKIINSSNSQSLKIPNHIYISFSISIFLSSFLLFQVQPIISKYILPWFGGSSAVWITAILFFQTLLLLGYLYVFLISRLQLKKQIIIHISLLVLITFNVLSNLNSSQIPILPNIKSGLGNNFAPQFQVLWILFIGTGLTYFILSTTSILLQKWFGVTYYGKSPYIFYSLSNIASLLALISYPFLVEPFFQLKTQGLTWSIGFLIYSIFLLVCCLQTFSTTLKLKQNLSKTKNNLKVVNNISRKKLFLWILLPAISSLMLMATTNLLTQSIAPIPFLWLLPLSIYLISFIICFSGKKWYLRNLYAYISLVTGFLSLAFMFGNIPSLLTGLIFYSLILLSACMICHGELYALRPASIHLDLYYLFIALGSVISGILVGIIAPLFFKGIWETYIGFYLTFLLTVWVLIHYKDSIFYRHLHFFAYSDKEAYIFALIAYPLTLIATPLMMNLLSGSNPITQKVWRNFYGVLSVKHKNGNNLTTLNHGNIIHGAQFTGNLQFEPTTYYGKRSGVGLAILNHPKYRKRIHIGIIGLGTGTLAAYGKKGDSLSFYEINPQVVEIAKSQFTYLKNSPSKINIVLGDGRLSLEKEVQENKEKYDLLIVDAFSDDAIPLHLLTNEALSVYLKRLSRPDGIIAFHISNQYIDLKPVLVQLAIKYHLQHAFINSPASNINMASEWALLTYNKKILEIPAIANYKYPENKKYKEISLWTDNYSNLFQVLK